MDEHVNEPENFGAEPGLSKDTRMWAMLCHIASFAMFTCIPFANIIGVAIVWLIKREESPFIDEHGKESLNFQITVTIAHFVAGLTWLLGIGVLLSSAILLYQIIMAIIAGMKANNGEHYRYPATIRLIQ